jgi:hypothetical protein
VAIRIENYDDLGIRRTLFARQPIHQLNGDAGLSQHPEKRLKVGGVYGSLIYPDAHNSPHRIEQTRNVSDSHRGVQSV